MQKGRTVSKASHAESVVVCDEDELGAQVEETLGRVLRLATASKSTAVSPDHDWQLLSRAISRRPDIKVETVLLGGTVKIGIGQRTIVYGCLYLRPFWFGPAEVACGNSGITNILVLVVTKRAVARCWSHCAVVELDSGRSRVR